MHYRFVFPNYRGSLKDGNIAYRILNTQSVQQLFAHNHMKEETRKATSRTKLIDLLGAEYLVLLNEQDDDDLKHHKNILQGARKIKVGPKPNGKAKRLERKFSIEEEPEDDTFNEEENQNLWDINNIRFIIFQIILIKKLKTNVNVSS